MMMMILRMTTNDYDPHGTDDHADSDGDVGIVCDVGVFGRALCIASHVRGRKGPGGLKLYQSIRQIKEVNFCSQLNL